MKITKLQNVGSFRIVVTSVGVTSALCSLTGPAQACSDLPNICQQQAQHHQNMVDIASTTQQEGGEGQVGNDSPAVPRQDPMAAAMTDIYSVGQASLATGIELATKRKDPKFEAAYQRYKNGDWDYFQDSPDPKPGEYCAALYAKGDVMVRISGPGGDYAGALMTFSGPDIPGSRDVRRIQVALNQSDGSSQSVQTFNYQLPGELYASIAFAVPTIEAAMAEMKDTQGFDVLLNGKSVAKLDWNDGLAARTQLEKCLSKRKAS